MTRICRDETCPECGHPETYAEIDFSKPTPGADAIGCSKCGWVQTAKRICYVVLVDQYSDEGYIPSAVTEGEPGHSPLVGRGELSTPWIWGKPAGTKKGYAQAKRVCAEANRELGLSEADVDQIVGSSMAAQNRAEAAVERVAAKLNHGG